MEGLTMPTPTPPGDAAAEMSLCETAYASPTSPWHIRRLTAAGKKLGGGADTLALCGRKVAWDLNVQMNAHHLSKNTCGECLAALQSLRGVR